MVDEARDFSNSHADWGELTLKNLQLKCNQYNISPKGTKKDLIDRLVKELDKRRRASENNNTLSADDSEVPGPSGHNGVEASHSADEFDYPPPTRMRVRKSRRCQTRRPGTG